MHTMLLVLIILVIAAAAVFALGFGLAGFSMGIRRQSLEEARAWQEAHYDISWFDGLEQHPYTVAGEDGYMLHVLLLRNPAPTDRYILISHGYTDNRFGALKYVKMYLDLGFHVIVYDLRGHGENTPTFCTYSVREGRDLAALIRDSRTRYPDARVFGIHGESLGSATSVACLKYHPDIDFVVADCGFSEITSVMEAGLKQMHLPRQLIHLAALCARVRFGYTYQQMRPIDSLKESTTPVLFLHGAADSFILPAHSQAMQRAARGYSEIHLIPEAAHAASILTAPGEYAQYVRGFLTKIGALEG